MTPSGTLRRRQHLVQPVGPSGWIGIYLDGHPDWADVAERLQHAHELAAPPRLKKAQQRETKG